MTKEKEECDRIV